MELQEYFDSKFIVFNENYIKELSKQDNGSINNVLNFRKEFCYGLQIFDDDEYMIFYIDRVKRLKGFGIELSLKLDQIERTNYTIEFCKILNNEFTHTDIVEHFNTFQDNCRTVFEQLGYFTIGNEFDNFNGHVTGLICGHKGVLKFPTLDKLEIYRWLFDENEKHISVDSNKVKKIYLLFDPNTNLIKIGQSYFPSLREKTLQGISPDWELITTWIAPIIEERKLHNMFKSKRKRGEWFDLNFNDLKKIKGYMKKYKNSL
ncbi:hypothetical protein EMN47_20185 [Prolixibacteraceae bacterium JC049]|nr:hypothetical protein [Prolixibacteraceae bacterium JC049]